jgi:hypothetical protein
MTEEQARKTADILIGAAAVGAAYFILRNPALRRMVWQLARTALVATAPAVVAEARRAWAEGAPPQRGI